MASSPGESPSETTEGPENEDNVKSSPTRFNPSVSDDVQDEDLEKVKGDAIGDTLYSERFVLSTLLKLTKLDKNINEDEDFEKDLCNLWDMTIEKDVVKLLLKHKVLELFSGIVKVTDDKRLTEILIGIIGNMCSLSETRDELCLNAEVTGPIIDLISCSDTLTLVQVMRLFHATLVFENCGDEITWFYHFKNSENFVDHFAYILMNSMNATLLVNTLEALNAICAKFAVIEIQPGVKDLSFRDAFVRPSLVQGVIEAFKTLLPDNPEKDLNDDTATPTQNSQKIMSLFLDIHVILSQYGKHSKECYEPVLEDLMKCISQILSPLCQPICLLPLTFNEQGVIENMNELFQAIGDPFDEVCFAQMIIIWHLIDADRENKEQKSQKWEEDDDIEDEINSEDICMTILEFLTRTVKNASDIQLKNCLLLHSPSTILKLLSVLCAGDSEPDIKECCNKIKSVFDALHEEATQTERDVTVDS